MVLSPKAGCPVVGKTVSHYRILEKLGEGGMGEVYVAEDTKLDRKVALKVLRQELTSDPERLARFEREAKAVAALNHPNIVTIYSVEEADGLRFIAMELVEGRTLAELMVEGGLTLSRFFALAVPIADALSSAHAHGVTHRDLTAANVMVSDEGRLKILDFGLAKLRESEKAEAAGVATETLTQEGRIMGTIPYMSPEQVQGKAVDHRSDIFSLGIILYEMTTGRRPFKGETSADLISSILRDTPKSVIDLKVDLPRHLGRIVKRCLAKDPERRYQTALDLRNELQDLKQEVVSGESATPETAIREAAPKAKKKVHRTPLVGREREQAELRRFLEQAERGQGTLVMIGGEPGVGRTRLVEEILEEAREHGCLALLGHCYEMEGTPPFIPWVEILEYTARIAPRETLRQLLGDAAPEVAKLMPELRRLFPDIPAPVALPPEQERRYLFNSFREFVERSSQVQPLLLVLEDLQWADESALLLLQHMAQHLGEMAVLIVGSYRDVELDAARPLAKTLRELVRERLAHRLALKRLPESGVAAMLRALSGQEAPASLVKVIHSETEGNPFFVEEIYQHLQEEGKLFDSEGRWRADLTRQEVEVPEGVRLVVGRRLERLSEEGRSVLTAAAVIGRRFSFELLEAIVDVESEELLDTMEEAERLHLIIPVSDARSREVRFTFPHELIRQTLVIGLSLLRRQRLHLRIAEAMERIYAGDLENRAPALAHHLYQAGAAADPQKTTHYLALAGRQALRAAAFEDALRLFEDAISLLPPEDKESRADLLFRRGGTLRSLGRWDAALEDWLEALPIYEELGDTRAAVRICRGLSFQYLWSLRPEESIELAQRGLKIVGEEPGADRCRLLASAGLSLAQAGDYTAAEEKFTEAVAMAEELESQPLLGEVLCFKSAHHMIFLQPQESVETGQRAVELLRSIGDLWQMAAAMSFCLTCLSTMGRWSEADRVAEELEPLAERLGHIGALLVSVGQRGARELALTGDFDAFEESARRQLDLSLRLGRSQESHISFGLVHFWRGRWQEALESFEKAVALAPSGYRAGTESAYLFLGKAYVGDKDAALSMLDERRAALPRAGQPNTLGAWEMLLGVVQGLVVLSQRDEAAKLYPLVLEAIDTGAVMRDLSSGLFQAVAGIAAAAGEQWDKAEEHYQTALRQAHELPHVIEQPEVRRWYAKMLIERKAPGDQEKAREFLTEATESYRQLGMRKHLEMAAALLKQL